MKFYLFFSFIFCAALLNAQSSNFNLSFIFNSNCNKSSINGTTEIFYYDCNFNISKKQIIIEQGTVQTIYQIQYLKNFTKDTVIYYCNENVIFHVQFERGYISKIVQIVNIGNLRTFLYL